MSRSSLGGAPPVRTKLWYLKNIDFLQGMTEEQMAMVEKRTVMREVRRREVFYLPGEASDRIYLLKRGVVKISTFVEGREVILALLKRGEVFGEEEVLEGSPRDHMAEAYEDALVCVLPREVFLDLMRANPEMAFKVTKLMGLRLRTFRSRVEGLLFKGASARLARVLLELAEEHGVEDARGTLLPLKLTQQDLASTRPHARFSDPSGATYEYGYLWWLRPFEVRGKLVATYFMSGAGGNRVAPDLRLVAVITAENFNRRDAHALSDRLLVEYIL